MLSVPRARPNAACRAGARGSHPRHGGRLPIPSQPRRHLLPDILASEREGPILPDRPIPCGRPERDDHRATIGTMAEPGPTIQIPRWVQLVGLPVLAVLAYLLASTLGHALFLFLPASLIAFLLNPLVRALQGARVPRGLGVAIVFLTFAAAVVVTVVAITTVVVDQTQSAAERIDAYVTEENGQSGLTGAERDVDRFQAWLDRRGIHVEIRA